MDLVLWALGAIGALGIAHYQIRATARQEAEKALQEHTAAIAVLKSELAGARAEISGLRESRHYHADRITELRRDVDHLKGKP